MTRSVFLDRFSANLNGSLIFTEVDLGEIAVAKEKKRALPGQSLYIISAALYYDELGNFSGSAAYNVIGPRIFSVGDVLFPTIYGMPRHSLDITLTKQVTSAASVQLGIQNLLNSGFEFYLDYERARIIDVNSVLSIISYMNEPIF